MKHFLSLKSLNHDELMMPKGKRKMRMFQKKKKKGKQATNKTNNYCILYMNIFALLVVIKKTQ